MTVLQSSLATLTDARQETDQLFQIVKPSFLYERPITERHRIVFYIGHLEAFDWNLLRESLNLRPFHPEFDQLFAFGIDPVDGENPSDQPSDWPSIHEIHDYVARIRFELNRALDDHADDARPLLAMATEHRLMHAETLEYMLHQLPFEGKLGEVSRDQREAAQPSGEMVEIPAGGVTLGFDGTEGSFGWDNEFAPHTETVPAFRIDKFKVTNGDFLKFCEAGGYQDQSLWSASDWQWKEQSGISRPAFWMRSNGGFAYRSMFGEVSLPLAAPVFASHAEAAAYARWAGKELPTEAEWQRASEGATAPAQTRHLWGPPAVTDPIANASRWGVEGLRGTGWEWTSTPFAPFEGFKASSAYPGYSANFFDGKHYVMKGGSTRTAASLLRKSFRNWFQAHYQYAYSGFRCVKRG